MCALCDLWKITPFVHLSFPISKMEQKNNRNVLLIQRGVAKMKPLMLTVWALRHSSNVVQRPVQAVRSLGSWNYDLQ